MRVLQVVKTTSGGQWAAWQAAKLVQAGIDVHAALPDTKGVYYQDWAKSGATLHIAQLNLPAAAPWKIPDTLRSARKLVDEVAPDLIHSHFVGTTLTLRYALGRHHRIKRIFQVPGPLHLEHAFYRNLELSSAGENDYWIPSSRCTQRLLEQSGIRPSRLFLSYYGWPLSDYAVERTYELRNMLGISKDQFIVGNISWFYKPKYHLGQTVGLKCHEDIIDAFAIVARKRRDVTGVLIGSGFNSAIKYENRLRARASALAGDRVKMPGALSSAIVQRSWPDFDCAVHVPISENCGGVMEPLSAGLPTIASDVGGLPELVINGLTGKVVPPRSPVALAGAILEVLDNLKDFRSMAANGRSLVSAMFDITRTAHEIHRIYKHLLNPAEPRPVPFDCYAEAQKLQTSSSARRIETANVPTHALLQRT